MTNEAWIGTETKQHINHMIWNIHCRQEQKIFERVNTLKIGKINMNTYVGACMHFIYIYIYTHTRARARARVCVCTRGFQLWRCERVHKRKLNSTWSAFTRSYVASYNKTVHHARNSANARTHTHVYIACKKTKKKGLMRNIFIA